MTEKPQVLVDKIYNKFQWDLIHNSLFKKQCRIFSSIKVEKDKLKIKKWEKSILSDYTSYYLAVYVTSEQYSKISLSNLQINNLRLHYISLQLYFLFNYNRRVIFFSPGIRENKKNLKSLLDVYDKSEQILFTMILDPKLEFRLGSQIFSFRPYKSTCVKLNFYLNLFKENRGWLFTGQIEKNYANRGIRRTVNYDILRYQIIKYFSMWQSFNSVNIIPKCSTDNVIYDHPVLYSPISPNSILYLKVLLSYLLSYVNNLIEPNSIEHFFVYGNKCILYSNSYHDIEYSIDTINTVLMKLGLNFLYSCITIQNIKLDKTKVNIDNYDFFLFNKHSYIQPQNLSIKKHFFFIKFLVSRSKGINQLSLIMKVNPIINNWSDYYKIYVNNKIMSRFDYQLFKILWQWCCNKFPKRNKLWIKNNCFRFDSNHKVVFAFTHSDGNITTVKRYHTENSILPNSNLKTIESLSFYDGNYRYWYRILFTSSILYREYYYLYKKKITLYSI